MYSSERRRRMARERPPHLG